VITLRDLAPDPFRPGGSLSADRVQVPDTAQYFSPEYGAIPRFHSYGVQVEGVRALGARSLLEIGPGPGVVSTYLRGAGLRVVTVDVDARLEPDVVGSIRALPFAPDTFEAVLCSQVLEHLPFDAVPGCLAEMRRVAATGAVISVPNQQPLHSLDAQLPFGRVHLSWPVPWRRPQRHEFDGEHYWELGARDYPVGLFREALRGAGWRVEREVRAHANPYHHFFFLR